MVTRSKMEEIAIGNIERHLIVEEDMSPDAVYDEAYTLALDALADAGVDYKIAIGIAASVATRFAQP